jgi:hypothetical protein
MIVVSDKDKKEQLQKILEYNTNCDIILNDNDNNNDSYINKLLVNSKIVITNTDIHNELAISNYCLLVDNNDNNNNNNNNIYIIENIIMNHKKLKILEKHILDYNLFGLKFKNIIDHNYYCLYKNSYFNIQI